MEKLAWLDAAYEYPVDAPEPPGRELILPIKDWLLDQHQENTFDAVSEILKSVDVTRLNVTFMNVLLRFNYIYYTFIDEWKPFALRCGDELLRREKKHAEITKDFEGILAVHYDKEGPKIALADEFIDKPEKKRRNPYS